MTPTDRDFLEALQTSQRFLASKRHAVSIFVPPPVEIVRCHCGDMNCHGWRLVERRSS